MNLQRVGGKQNIMKNNDSHINTNSSKNTLNTLFIVAEAWK